MLASEFRWNWKPMIVALGTDVSKLLFPQEDTCTPNTLFLNRQQAVSDTLFRAQQTEEKKSFVSAARLLAVCRTVRRSMYAHKRRPGERQYKQILCHNACHTLSLTAWSVFVCNKTVSHLFRSSVAFPHSTDTRSVKLSFGDRKQIKRKKFYFKFSFNLICFIFPCQTQIVNSTVSDTLFAN